MKIRKAQSSESFLVSAILAVSGGFQDAYTYNTREQVFSNAQTGNVVLMSQHFMMQEWLSGLHYLVPLVAVTLCRMMLMMAVTSLMFTHPSWFTSASFM